MNFGFGFGFDAAARAASPVTVAGAISGRTVTLTATWTGEGSPTLTLTALTAGGVDVLSGVTGTGPWAVDIDDAAVATSVAWTISDGTQSYQGIYSAPANLLLPASGEILFEDGGSAVPTITVDPTYAATLTGATPAHTVFVPPLVTTIPVPTDVPWSASFADAISGPLVTDGVMRLSPKTIGETYYMRPVVAPVGASTAPAAAYATTYVVTLEDAEAVELPTLNAPSVTATGATTATATTNVASDGGGTISRTDTRWSTDDATWTTLNDTGGVASLTGLPAETLIYVQQRATNEAGAGAWSASGTATTDSAAAAAPAAPGQPTLNAGQGAATLTLAATADDGGATLSRYEYEIDADGEDFSTPIVFGQQAVADVGDPIGVAPLDAGDYKARARAVNAVGASPWSTTSAVATVTSAPSGLPSFTDVTLSSAHIVPSDTAPVTDQIVHFHLDAALLATEAGTAATALSQTFDSFDFRREMEVYWRVENPDGSTYDERAYTAIPAAYRFHPRYTTGGGVGPFFGHVFATSGTYTIEVTAYFRNRKYSITRTIAVSARALGAVGVYDPDGDFTDAPAGTQYTDIDTAAAALDADTIDTLYMRAGKAASKCRPVNGITLRDAGAGGSGKAILPWGGAAGETINVDATGRDSLAGAALADFVADGSSAFTDADFSGTWDLGGTIAVYVDDVRADPADYTITTDNTADDGISWSANAPTNTQRVRIFSVNDEGKILNAGGANLLSMRGTRALVKGFNAVGGYDPSDPSRFDPADLSTFDSNAQSGAFSFFGTNCISATLLDSRATGFAVCVSSGGGGFTGTTIGIVNCYLSDYSNYAMFLETFPKVCILGTWAAQNAGSFNQYGKIFNSPLRANTADHGSIRMPETVMAVVQRNMLHCVNDWNKNDFRLGAQPIVRSPQSSTFGQSCVYSENVLVAGSGQGPGGGPPNAANVSPTGDIITCANNIHIATEITGAYGSGGKLPLVSFNEVFYSLQGTAWDDTDSGSKKGFGSGAAGSYFNVGDNSYEKPRIILSPTFFLQVPAAGNFTLVERATLVSANGGLNNMIGYAVADGTSDTVTVPFHIPFLAKRATDAPRIYFKAAADVVGSAGDQINQNTAQSWATTGEQAAVFDADLTQLGGPSSIDGTKTDFDYSKNPGESDGSTTITIRRRAGNFTAGDVIYITSTGIYEVEDRFDLSGVKQPELSAGPNGYTFAINQAVGNVDLRVPAPIIKGDLVVIPDAESFVGYRRGSDDAFIDATGSAVDNLRATHWAPLSGLYQKPGVGSAAVEACIPAADEPRAHRDLLWNERPQAQTLGALEVASTHPTVPTMLAPAIFTVGWASGVLPLRDGDVIDAASVDVTFSENGVPDQSATPDIRYITQAETVADPLWSPNGLDTTKTLSAGDLVRYVVQVDDFTTGARTLQSAFAGVLAASYQPEWIRNTDGVDYARWKIWQGAAAQGLPEAEPDAVIAFRFRLPNDPSGYNGDFARFSGATGDGRGGVAMSNGVLETRPNSTAVSSTLSAGDEISIMLLVRPSVADPGDNIIVEWSLNGVRQTDVAERAAGLVIDNFNILLGFFANGLVMDVSDWVYVGSVPAASTPAYEDFFETDHTPKQILADLTLGGKATALGFTFGAANFQAGLNFGSNADMPDLQTDNTNPGAWTGTGDIDATHTRVTHGGVTFEVAGVYTAGNFDDGPAYIVIPSGSADMSEPTPVQTTIDGYVANGAMVNPQHGEGQAFDARPVTFGGYTGANLADTWPLSVSAGDVVVKAISNTDAAIDPTTDTTMRRGLVTEYAACYILTEAP